MRERAVAHRSSPSRPFWKIVTQQLKTMASQAVLQGQYSSTWTGLKCPTLTIYRGAPKFPRSKLLAPKLERLRFYTSSCRQAWFFNRLCFKRYITNLAVTAKIFQSRRRNWNGGMGNFECGSENSNHSSSPAAPSNSEVFPWINWSRCSATDYQLPASRIGSR